MNSLVFVVFYCAAIDGREKKRKFCSGSAPIFSSAGIREPSMSIRSALLLAGVVALVGATSVRAEESAMKQCADKWQAAKAANTTGGLSYLQFSSKCRADLKAAPAAAAPAAPAAPVAPTTAAAPKPVAPAAPAAPAAAGAAVFPSAIAPAYTNEKPGKARMKTCVDQYNANKAAGGNGGLKWIQKGGGYYSQCNARLKG
jgi:hypothetical protein